MKLLLTAVAALLYVLGWLAGLAAVVVLWCWSATAVGWDDARRLAQPRDEPRRGERRPVRAR